MNGFFLILSLFNAKDFKRGFFFLTYSSKSSLLQNSFLYPGKPSGQGLKSVLLSPDGQICVKIRVRSVPDDPDSIASLSTMSPDQEEIRHPSKHSAACGADPARGRGTMPGLAAGPARQRHALALGHAAIDDPGPGLLGMIAAWACSRPAPNTPGSARWIQHLSTLTAPKFNHWKKYT